MTDKICLILHRKSANRPEVKAAVKAVQKHVDLRVLIPWNKEDKSVVVQEAISRGAERIIAGGGDGTINAVVRSLVSNNEGPCDIELGVMPLGTANDFARGCRLPKDDLTECLRIAATRDTRLVDVGLCNNNAFINVASAGFGAEITATTPIKLKEKLGGSAYTLMGLVRAFEFSPYQMALSIPGQSKQDLELLVMAIGNNHFAGGGFDVAPFAKLNDGLLDLMAICKTDNLLDVNLRDEYENPMSPDNKIVKYMQLSEFTIKTPKKLYVNLDGEPVHKKKFHFKTLPKHIKLAY